MSRGRTILITCYFPRSVQLAVITSGIGGFGETVAPGQTGLLVPPSDPDAMASAIAAATGDSPAVHAMEVAARRVFERECCTERTVERLAEVLGS